MHANEPTRFANTKRKRAEREKRTYRETPGQAYTGHETVADGITRAIQDGRRFAGRHWVRSEIDATERVRADIERWANELYPNRFGTLTLRTEHGSTCRRHDCDGNEKKGTADCHVPGVQATEIAMVQWLGLVESGLVVEEVGDTTGRRHFHYLAIGTGVPAKQLLVRGKCRKRCYQNGANRFWEGVMGHVDESEVRNMTAVVKYTTKYVLKAQGENDDDARTILRWWWKWPEQQRGGNGTGDDEDAVPGFIR